MVEALKPFTEVRFVTKDGENISATKQDGIVTIVGDKNGVRQMPLDSFMEYMVENAPNVNLEKTPDKDTVNFKGKTSIKIGPKSPDNCRQIDLYDKKGDVQSLVVSNDKIDEFQQSRELVGKKASKCLAFGAVLSAAAGLATGFIDKNKSLAKKNVFKGESLVYGCCIGVLGFIFSLCGAAAYQESKLQKLNNKFIEENTKV